MTTIGDVLFQAQQRLTDQSNAPAVEARRLLGALLHQNSTWLVIHANDEISAEAEQRFFEALQRRLNGYPLAYLIGQWGFYHWDFLVNEHVLIPRPETELLVETASTWLQARPDLQEPTIIDIGTGSGIIGISMALLHPQARVVAIDISPDALSLAQMNADQLGASTIEFRQSNLLADVPRHQFDLILANLPYIDHQALPYLDVAQHEPHLALNGGSDGLDLIEPLIKQSVNFLKPLGAIYLEIGDNQGNAVSHIGQAVYPKADISVLQDLNQRDRLVVIQT